MPARRRSRDASNHQESPKDASGGDAVQGILATSVMSGGGLNSPSITNAFPLLSAAEPQHPTHSLLDNIKAIPSASIKMTKSSNRPSTKFEIAF